MEKLKCANCGLVNWSGAVECERCHQKVRVARRPAAVEYRQPLAGSTTNIGRVGVIAIILGLAGFGTFQYSVSTVEPQKEDVTRQKEIERRQRAIMNYSSPTPGTAESVQVRDFREFVKEEKDEFTVPPGESGAPGQQSPT